MDTPELPATVVSHEEAAHERRNWVRLTFDCNDRCVFCLDAHTHDGTIRDREEVKAQILDGRRRGATRLILSGGEPTIHPHFVDFVRLGRRAGYRKIQTVTNGRMFAYPAFLQAALDAGLSEITFSIHGPNARIHDALVGTRGAFDEEVQGLKNALADGRPIINIDVCVNRGNVRQLPELLATFTAMGVKEYDLLHVIPFGRAYSEGREVLFYDLEAMRPYLLEAFAYARKPGIHLWLNRFPPQHLEGFEDLIQDPHKLVEEVRGRKEEYGLLLEHGVPLDCRAPERCKHCYLQPLCDRLDAVRDQLAARAFAVLRVDAGAEQAAPAAYGGDPASKMHAEARLRRVLAERALQAGLSDHAPEDMPEQTAANSRPADAADLDGTADEAAAGMVEARRLRPPIHLPIHLPLLGNGPAPAPLAAPGIPPKLPAPALAAEAGARALWIVAPDLARAEAIAAAFPAVPALELELADSAGLLARVRDLTSGTASEDPPLAVTIAGKRLARVVVAAAEDAAALLAAPIDVEVSLQLSRASEPWLRSLAAAPPRLVLVQPTHERLTESAARDVDLPGFFSAFTLPVPVEGVPACVLGRPPRARPPVFDAAQLAPDGGLEIFRYVRRFIADGFRIKSLRCKTCTYDPVCSGMHINYVRAHGFAAMQPVAPA